MTTPTVYFIDDSATMREVIKIAFRRENINVVACHDGVSALSEMEHNHPDVVISDVIMPEKDGYEVCQHIKQHPELGKTPVILMSGVVNRTVAEKAFAVKADELIRKPFQPQDLITRVRHLLNPNKGAPVPPSPAANAASAALSSIFTQQPAARPAAAPPRAPVPIPSPPAPKSAEASAPPPVPKVSGAGAAADVQKLRIELLRNQQLVKKLQSELQAEREYARALEEHIKTLQEAE
jgi:CheY-like chemotaxis protein